MSTIFYFFHQRIALQKLWKDVVINRASSTLPYDLKLNPNFYSRNTLFNKKMMVKKSYHKNKPCIFLRCLSVLNIFFKTFFYYRNFTIGSDLIGNKPKPNLHSHGMFFDHLFLVKKGTTGTTLNDALSLKFCLENFF